MTDRSASDTVCLMTGSSNILDAAMKVFSKKGYRGSSIADITKEAGVSKALFYHYFKSKRDLLVIFAKKRLEDFLPLIEGLQADKPPEERLCFLINFVLNELEREPAKLRFYNMLYLSEDGVTAIEVAMTNYREQFERLFSAEKTLFSDLGFSDPVMEATFMRSTLQGISLEYLLGPADYPLEKMKKKLIARYLTKRGNA